MYVLQNQFWFENDENRGLDDMDSRRGGVNIVKLRKVTSSVFKVSMRNKEKVEGNG